MMQLRTKDGNIVPSDPKKYSAWRLENPNDRVYCSDGYSVPTDTYDYEEWYNNAIWEFEDHRPRIPSEDELNSWREINEVLQSLSRILKCKPFEVVLSSKKLANDVIELEQERKNLLMKLNKSSE